MASLLLWPQCHHSARHAATSGTPPHHTLPQGRGCLGSREEGAAQQACVPPAPHGPLQPPGLMSLANQQEKPLLAGPAQAGAGRGPHWSLAAARRPPVLKDLWPAGPGEQGCRLEGQWSVTACGAHGASSCCPERRLSSEPASLLCSADDRFKCDLLGRNGAWGCMYSPSVGLVCPPTLEPLFPFLGALRETISP